MRRLVPAGAVLIVAVGLGLALWTSNDRVQIAAPAATARLDRPLQFKVLDASTPLRALTGRVLGPSGPIAGAFVLVTSDDDGAFSTARCSHNPEATFFECHCGPVAEGLAWRFAEGEGEATPIASAVSRPDGTFEVANVPTGRFAVWADTPAGAAVALDVDPSSSIELMVRSGRVVEGRTQRPDGGALAGALVGAVFQNHSRFFLTKSDEHGAYRVGPIPEGDYELVATAAGFTPRNWPPEHGTTFELQESRRVTGTVTIDGRPAPGVEVRAPVFCSDSTTVTNARGQFELTRLLPEKAPTALTSRILWCR